MLTFSRWQHLLLNSFSGFQVDLFELINGNIGFLAHFLNVCFISLKIGDGCVSFVSLLHWYCILYCFSVYSSPVETPSFYLTVYLFKGKRQVAKRPSFFKWSKLCALYGKGLYLVKFVLGLSVRLRRRRWRRSIGWLIDYTNFKFLPNKQAPYFPCFLSFSPFDPLLTLLH